MKHRILITGATGKVGRHLTRILTAADRPVRAAVHTPAHAADLAGTGAELVHFDFEHANLVSDALKEVHTVVLLTPPDARQVDWATETIDRAKAAGVSRIVRLSVLAAAMEPGIRLGRWHRTVERYLQASGLDWSIVRPSPFMQNFQGMYPSTAGGWALPAADAAVNHIHVADVARALAEVTLSSAHDGRIYMVTGPGPLTMQEAAARIAAAGSTASYTAISPDEARAAFSSSGRPAWLVEILLELFAAFRTGAVGLSTSTFEDLTGEPLRTFDDFAAEIAARLAA